ncbi:phage tail tip lysozyme [Pseudomonas veronii]|uniref:phage tail tip lysozyme n=1 Tax=Pseudomonas veronii TaxID=76761 RepID=UPI001E58EB5D|nr:phage tail tip lysozyme [Pseudomonas veronii]UHH28292.1 phage tail tip lysozyme [Pseudomonas veronii]
MGNTFTITIDAVDKASATVRKVNDSVSRLTRPFEEVGKSFKSLGRELGFERIGKNLTSIGREAGGAARSIGNIVAPMAAITGIGSVAGVAALAVNWAKLGRSIDSSAHGIGISADQLQTFQGAAKMVGIDTELATGSLNSLATTMQDAQWGRNQGALLMLNKLGIGLKKAKDGSWDVVGEYKAIANAIASQKSPQVQSLIANNLGLGGMLPFLREGAAGIEHYETMVKRLGYVMSDDAVKRGKEFSQSLSGLNLVIDGTKNSIGDKLIPVMKPLVDQFTNWLAVNRELIANDIGEWAKGFAIWINKVEWKKIGDGIVNFGKGVGKVVEWMGGWQNAALLVIGVMNAGLIGSVLSLGVTLVRGGAGVLAFTKLLLGWEAAAVAAGAATSVAGTAGAGMGAAGAGVAGAAGAGTGALIGATAAGLGATFYSSSLNDGEDKEVARIRRAQGLPEVSPSEILSSAWKAKGGINEDSTKRSMQFFQDKGWTKEQAAGISANLGLESNFDPTAVGDSGRAYGIAQWHDSRQKEFAKWAGKPIKNSTLDEQLGFVHYELTKGGETAAGDALRATKTAAAAGDVVTKKYERPADMIGDAAKRAAVADILASSAVNISSSPPPNTAGPSSMMAAPAATPMPTPQAAPTPARAPEGPYTQGAAQGSTNGSVKVEIEHKNAPEGLKTKVKSDGNVQASSRIAYSGMGAAA